jgi:tetrapyrrole methylase family protein/MazG family protein
VTLRSLRVLTKTKKVYVRTAQHPALAILNRFHIPYRALDFFYRKSVSFEQTYRNIAFFIINSSLIHGRVAYIVPGSALFAEKTVEIILEKAAAAGIRCRIIPSVSFLEAVAADAGIPHAERLVVLDVLEPDKLLDFPHRHVLLVQCYSRQIASRTKILLNQIYPDDHPVTVIRGAGLPGECKKVTVPLYRIDHLRFVDHLTTFYLPPAVSFGLEDLLRVMRSLRGSSGCPWDREQDHRSLRPYLLEEAYEVLDAIDRNDTGELCEELGDLLLQIVFHSQIAHEEKDFSFYDVIAAITEKLIRRHPHVFGGAEAKTADDVISSWQRIKKDEKDDRKSLFTLESYLPALLRAQKIQRQASSVGFDWPDASGAWDKLSEELKELKDAYNQQDEVKIEEEMGDLLFAVVNVARFLQVDAEQALGRGTSKFYKRLRFVEEMARAQGGEMSDYPLSKLDEWWEDAKSWANGEKTF